MKRLALAAALCSALLGAGAANGELVPGSAGAQDSALALAPDGSPRIAYVAADGASIVYAARTVDGIWAAEPVPLARVPSELVGFAVAPTGAVLLVEAVNGSSLRIAEQTSAGWRVRTVARAPTGGVLGLGGLALDPGGRPLVAYPFLLPSRKSSLRLVHEDGRGRLVGERVTRDGFPASETPPTAAPVVLPGGAVRVVEGYAGGTIEWARTSSRRDWVGQFLYANALGSAGGVVRAAANAGGGVWSAWTELFADSGESDVILCLHSGGEHAAVLDGHAFLAGLASGSAGPEVAADEYVTGTRTVYAGLVLDASGGSLELAGDLEGYALDPAGGRDYLLRDVGGVSWYRSPTPPGARVELADVIAGSSVTLTGRVRGAAPGGAVEIWREADAGPVLAATLPLAPDGGFTWTETPPPGTLTYRAVYRDAATGLPLAALLRTGLGA